MARLTVPAEWISRYAYQRYPQTFSPTAFESGRLTLSIDPRRDYGADLSQVVRDLRDGIIVETRRGNDGPYYVLHGTLHRVFADPSIGGESGTPMARVTSIKAGNGFSRREPVRPGDISFAPLWDETYCDLARTVEDFNDAIAAVRRRRAVLDHARNRDLAPGGPEVSSYGAQHRAVRQRYQPLKTMLRLLELRMELADQVETQAVVTYSDDDRIELRVVNPAGLTEDRPVTLDARGRRVTLSIRTLDGTDCELPQAHRPLVAGERVTLVQRNRFAMNKHNAALTRFLDAHVEGNWDRLASLLCDPGTLRPGRPAPPSRYLSGVPLNREQKAAVTGALSTPHAFLIQGPPGTGKTTVIVELVLQLVTRGERVLLLAPMHVAVDEVLGRIGDRPEVFAIRLSYDDAKVGKELQRFLLPRISEEYLRRARTPATSKAEIWRDERAQCVSSQQAVAAHVAAARAAAAADAATSATSATFRAWEEQFQHAWSLCEQRRQAADQALQQLADAVPSAQRRAAELAQQVAAAPTGQRLRSWLRRTVGQHDELRRLSAAARSAAVETDRLLDLRARWGRERVGLDAAFVNLHNDRDSRGRQLYAAWHTDQAASAQAAHELARAAKMSALPSGTDPAHALTDLDRQIADLDRRIALEQRWFELVQPEDADRFTQEMRRASNVFCCTTAGVSARDLDGIDFDTLIVDEASRVTDSEFLIGANRARRWIMVGDEHQLPPFVDTADEHHLHALAALHRVARRESRDLDTAVDELAAIWQEDEELHAFRTGEVRRTAAALEADGTWQRAYRNVLDAEARQATSALMLRTMLDHLVHSLFARAVTSCEPGLRQRLVEQRRMIEPIAALVRDPVYGGDYRSPDPADLARLGITPLTSTAMRQPVILLDTSSYGERARHQPYRNGCFNALEIEWIVDTCRGWERELLRTGAPRVTVSVLAFYRRQAALIRHELGWPLYPEFRALKFLVVDAIDKIQGQEADLVLVSFCRAYLGRNGPRPNTGRWLQDVRRLNVACTRARRALVLVGHGDTLRRLNGVEAAELFYANLFARLDGDTDGYGRVTDR